MERDNIILLMDEAHRTQEGDLGKKVRTALQMRSSLD